MCSQLLVDMLRFLAPFIRNVQMTRSMQALYRGVFRIFFVLFHDFQDFLTEYYYAFLVELPPNAIQLRNVILSPFPKGLKLPELGPPLTLFRHELMELHEPNLQRASFPELIRNEEFRRKLEAFLLTKAPVTFLSELRTMLMATPGLPEQGPIAGSRYNLQMINGLVLFVGLHAISVLKQHMESSQAAAAAAAAQGGMSVEQGQSMSVGAAQKFLSWGAMFQQRKQFQELTVPHVDVFESLLVELDNEGRYLLCSAMVSHLRYPNPHTLFFGNVLITLMHCTSFVAGIGGMSGMSGGIGGISGATAGTPGVVREIIMRCLLERVIAGRPYPWGVVNVMQELARDPKLELHKLDFMRFHPDMEKYAHSLLHFSYSPLKWIPKSLAVATSASGPLLFVNWR